MIRKFRYDINALRAIAVIGVIAFHFRVAGFGGGFCGVDIFFVISGYLMSRIIINAIEDGNFSIIGFYVKRLKRIVPALLVLIIIVTLCGFFFYFPNDYKLNETNAAASIAFVSNILYWKNSNYFDPASDTNIFLHTWSLSVEWQFYILYPLILLYLLRIAGNRRKFINIFLWVTALICLISIFINYYNPTASFYLLPTRSWEMMVGGIAFMLESKIGLFKFAKIINICGYLTIILCIILLNIEVRWPGLLTLLPVVATFVIIATNRNDNAILKYKSLQFIGTISYSLYLWHWPVYVGANYLGIETTYLSIIVLIILSFLLAFISFRFVESSDVLHSGMIIATMVFFLICTVVLSRFNFNEGVFDTAALKIANYKDSHKIDIQKQFVGEGCFLSSQERGIQDFNADLCLHIQENKKNILLIGDSHAADVAGSIREKLKERNINLIEATASGCLPVIDAKGEKRCTDLLNYVYRKFIIKNKDKIDGVILSANWLLAGKDKQGDLLKNINNTIAYLEQCKIPAVIIGQNETYRIPYPIIAARIFEHKKTSTKNFLDVNSLKMEDFLRKKLPEKYIDIYNSLSVPPLSADNLPYMFDENHYTKYGANLVAKRILLDSVTLRFLKREKGNL